MIVKVLGSGCNKCKTLETQIQKLKENYNLDIEIEKITQINDIISYGVMMTPGLIINGEIKSVGKIPKDDQILKWIKGE